MSKAEGMGLNAPEAQSPSQPSQASVKKPLVILTPQGNRDYLLQGLRCLGYEVDDDENQCYNHPDVARRVAKGGVWVHYPKNWRDCNKGLIYRVRVKDLNEEDPEEIWHEAEEIRKALDMGLALLLYIWDSDRNSPADYMYIMRTIGMAIRQINSGEEVDVSDIEKNWKAPAWHDDPAKRIAAEYTGIRPIIIPIRADVEGIVMANALKYLGYKVRSVEGECTNQPGVAQRMADGGVWLFQIDEWGCGLDGSPGRLFEVDIPEERVAEFEEKALRWHEPVDRLIKREITNAVRLVESLWDYYRLAKRVWLEEVDFVYVVKKLGEALRAYNPERDFDKIFECLWRDDREFYSSYGNW